MRRLIARINQVLLVMFFLGRSVDSRQWGCTTGWEEGRFYCRYFDVNGRGYCQSWSFYFLQDANLILYLILPSRASFTVRLLRHEIEKGLHVNCYCFSIWTWAGPGGILTLSTLPHELLQKKILRLTQKVLEFSRVWCFPKILFKPVWRSGMRPTTSLYAMDTQCTLHC